jgi:hypothetical protein
MLRLTCHLRFFAVLLACLSIGLHWSAVQVVGWVGMAVEFARTRPVADALEMTFDGKHPCNLCKLVQNYGPLSDLAPQTPPESNSELKLLVASIWENPLPSLNAPAEIVAFPDELGVASMARQRPPVPPPRVALHSACSFAAPPRLGAGSAVVRCGPFLLPSVHRAVGAATYLVHS